MERARLYIYFNTLTLFKQFGLTTMKQRWQDGEFCFFSQTVTADHCQSGCGFSSGAGSYRSRINHTFSARDLDWGQGISLFPCVLTPDCRRLLQIRIPYLLPGPTLTVSGRSTASLLSLSQSLIQKSGGMAESGRNCWGAPVRPKQRRRACGRPRALAPSPPLSSRSHPRCCGLVYAFNL
jgi:hypothetical protein